MRQNSLRHYGVMGMKWGVRKGRNSSSRSSSRKSFSRKKNVKSLSNDELQRTIRRIELEKRYTQLTSNEKRSKSKWVKTVISDSATSVAKQYTTQYMSKQVGKMLKTPPIDTKKKNK